MTNAFLYKVSQFSSHVSVVGYKNKIHVVQKLILILTIPIFLTIIAHCFTDDIFCEYQGIIDNFLTYFPEISVIKNCFSW